MSKQIQMVAADGLRLEKTENFNLGPGQPNREYRHRDWLEPDGFFVEGWNVIRRLEIGPPSLAPRY